MKEKNALESSEQTPQTDDLTVTPTENKEAEKIKEDIDPRIVSIVGEENIQSVYEGQEDDPDKQEDVETDKKEEEEKEKSEEDQEKKVEDSEIEIPAITPPDPKPTRLDKRIAKLFIRNLHLSGAEEIPTEEEIIDTIKGFSKDEKIAEMHFQRLEGKKMLGESVEDDTPDQEDEEIIRDAERESIRQEIINEENEKRVKSDFVQYIDSHPELHEEQKEYNPSLARAVETLWRGGMSIQEAHKTVIEQIESVKKEQAIKESKEKDKALSGVLSGSGQSSIDTKKLDWEAVAKIEKENPSLYRKMLAEGKFKHL